MGFVKFGLILYVLCGVSDDTKSHSLPFNGGQWSSDGYSSLKGVSSLSVFYCKL